MKIQGIAKFFLFLMFSTLLSALVGCAGSAVVRPGDIADVRFLCWLKNGEVVAATDKSVANRKDMPKSPVFLERAKQGPVPIEAVAPGAKVGAEKEVPFEIEIMDRLAREIVGMKQGESRTIGLAANNVPGRERKDYVVTMPRVRFRPKEMRMTIGDCQVRTGNKKPKAGQTVNIYPEARGRIEAVTKDECVIRFSAKPGTVIATAFGPGTITESKDNYEITINARKGALVRTGPLVGRITDVDGDNMTIDYRNPFGGEALVCGVGVEKIEKKKDK